MTDGGGPDDDVGVLLSRMAEVGGRAVTAYADYAKRVVRNLTEPEQPSPEGIFRDAWMTWAGTAGDWVEISYLAAAVADGFLTRRNQAG